MLCSLAGNRVHISAKIHKGLVHKVCNNYIELSVHSCEWAALCTSSVTHENCSCACVLAEIIGNIM